MCKMNFTGLSCYLSMTFTQTLTPNICWGRLLMAPTLRRGSLSLDALRSYTAGVVELRSH